MSDAFAAAQALIARIHVEIPLTAAMQLEAVSHDGHTLVLRAPLAPNINDKGTAFAGSIAALGNITGWCLLTLWSECEVGNCRVAVADASFSFRKPLQGDFMARVSLPGEQECAALKAALLQKGRGKMRLQVSLADAGGEAVTLDATYAVWVL